MPSALLPAAAPASRAGAISPHPLPKLVHELLDLRQLARIEGVGGTAAVVARNDAAPLQDHFLGFDDQFGALHPITDVRQQLLMQCAEFVFVALPAPPQLNIHLGERTARLDAG